MLEPTDLSANDPASLKKRDERLARTEVAFREANESIQEIAGALGGDDYQFVCECSNGGCIEMVTLTRREYEGVRAEGTRFLVIPGHENAAVEVVVGKTAEYLVVEKSGRAGTVAAAADPRDGDL